VSFAKGCYPGQEIVARTRYLGKLKRNPVLVEVDGLIPDVVGESCTVFSEAKNLEAVVVEALALEPEDGNAAGTHGAKTLVLIVAPMEETADIDAVEVVGRTWTARRLRPERAA
jgi:folate-binding Fe-S cluster repair protein YgfZ